MPPIHHLLIGVLFPCLVAFTAALLITRGGEARRWWSFGLAALVAGVTFSLARWWMYEWWHGSWKGLWPQSLYDRQAIAALLLGVIAWSTAKLPGWLRVVITTLGVAACLVPIALRAPDFTVLHRVIAVAMALPIAAVAVLSDGLSRTRSALTLPPAVLIAPVAASIAFLNMSNATQAQATGIICAILGATWGAAWFTRRFAPGVLVWALAMIGIVFVLEAGLGDKPHLIACFLLLLAPLGILVGELPGIRSRSWLAAVARAVAVAIPAGIAVILTMSRAQEVSSYY